MAIIKHVPIKNADYSKALEYLLFKHAANGKPVRNENGNLIMRDGVLIDGINCGAFSFDKECEMTNWQFHKNQGRNDVKAHHYILSFDPQDSQNGNLDAERAHALGMEFASRFFPGHNKDFGINGEILIDHAWGIEPVTMQDIKSYRTGDHSISNGQVLPKPYAYPEARVAFAEMIELLCAQMFEKNVICKGVTWWVSYDYKSLEHCPEYDGEITRDFYGRLHPKHSNGTFRMAVPTNSISVIRNGVLAQFDAKTDHRLLYRRLGVNAIKVTEDSGIYQLDLFTDYDALARERKIQGAMLEIRRRFGPNAVLKGMNLLDGAMTRERNEQIGGHKA